MLSKTDTGWVLRAPTITELVYQAVRQQANCANPDAILSIETHLFDVILCADSCEYSLDVGKELHLNIGRWSRLIKEYLPREPWERFRDQAVMILKGDARKGAAANMMFHDPDRHAKKHFWGGCLMGATFRMGPTGYSGTLTFYSRTSYIGYMGILDCAIAHVMARSISDAVDREDPREHLIRFQWHLASMQLHAFKSLPYVYRKPALNRHLEKLVRNRRMIPHEPPWWRYAAKWQIYFEDKYAAGGVQAMLDEKYGPSRRVFRRWLETKGVLKTHIPPSLTVDELTFEKAL